MSYSHVTGEQLSRSNVDARVDYKPLRQEEPRRNSRVSRRVRTALVNQRGRQRSRPRHLNRLL